jgi:2-oxoglutarate-Fe(II)-dependent oxygenase superfamily protein
MVVLRGFLRGDRLERVLVDVRSATWEPHRDEIANELVMVENSASALLHFLMHDAELFRLIRGITDCSPVGRFRGRIYRMYPNVGHLDDWHNDLAGGRLAAISINLNEQAFEGGSLEMRDARTKAVLATAPPLQLGDAVVLRLSRDLEHRVTEVGGQNPKTAFAGFFFDGETSLLTLPRTTTRTNQPA